MVLQELVQLINIVSVLNIDLNYKMHRRFHLKAFSNLIPSLLAGRTFRKCTKIREFCKKKK